MIGMFKNRFFLCDTMIKTKAGAPNLLSENSNLSRRRFAIIATLAIAVLGLFVGQVQASPILFRYAGYLGHGDQDAENLRAAFGESDEFEVLLNFRGSHVTHIGINAGTYSRYVPLDVFEYRYENPDIEGIELRMFTFTIRDGLVIQDLSMLFEFVGIPLGNKVPAPGEDFPRDLIRAFNSGWVENRTSLQFDDYNNWPAGFSFSPANLISITSVPEPKALSLLCVALIASLAISKGIRPFTPHTTR